MLNMMIHDMDSDLTAQDVDDMKMTTKVIVITFLNLSHFELAVTAEVLMIRE